MRYDDPPCITELKSKCVHARKRHKCDWRSNREHYIEKGDAYMYIVYLNEDDVFVADHVCYECYHGYPISMEIE